MGAALAKRLGKGWKPHVKENMGWHYSARNGGWNVHADTYKGVISYTAFLGRVGSLGGKWAEHGDTPEEAIENTKAVALADVSELLRICGIELPADVAVS